MVYQKQTPEAWASQLNFAGLEQRYGLPSGLLTAVCRQESAGNPNAQSPAGACGLFQFMPGTAADFGINPYDPAQSADAAAKYLSQHLSRNGGDVAKALASYNWGPGNVNKTVERYGDNWLAHAPAETKNYVASISGRLRGEMFWRPSDEMPRPTRNFEENERYASQQSQDSDTNWMKQLSGSFMDSVGAFGGILLMLFAAMGLRQQENTATTAQNADTPNTPATSNAPQTDHAENLAKAQEQARSVPLDSCAVSTGVCRIDAPNVPSKPSERSIG